jgi:hypothetical protein
VKTREGTRRKDEYKFDGSDSRGFSQGDINPNPPSKYVNHEGHEGHEGKRESKKNSFCL